MSILDEKEPTVGLKLVVVIVGLLTFGVFGTLFFVTGPQIGHQTSSSAQETL